MNENGKHLVELLKKYPHPNHIGEDHRNAVVGVCLAADLNGWTKDFIRICESNPNVTFDDILELIYTPERFPPLEIYDDDTGEILGYGHEGNFPNGRPE